MTLIFKSRHFKRTLLVIVLIGGMWYLYVTRGQDTKRREVRRDGPLSLQDRMQEILAAREWLAENSVRMGYSPQTGRGSDPYSPNRLFNNPPPRSVYRFSENGGGGGGSIGSVWGPIPGPFAGGSGDLNHFRHGAQAQSYPDGGGWGGGGVQQKGGGGGYGERSGQGWGALMTNGVGGESSGGGNGYGPLQQGGSELFNNNNNNNNNIINNNKNNNNNNNAGYRAWNTNAYENQLLNSPFHNFPVNPDRYPNINPNPPNTNFQPFVPRIPEQDPNPFAAPNPTVNPNQYVQNPYPNPNQVVPDPYQFVQKADPNQNVILSGSKPNLGVQSDVDNKNIIALEFKEDAHTTVSDQNSDDKVASATTESHPSRREQDDLPMKTDIYQHLLTNYSGENKISSSEDVPAETNFDPAESASNVAVKGNNPKENEEVPDPRDNTLHKDIAQLPPLVGQPSKLDQAQLNHPEPRLDNAPISRNMLQSPNADPDPQPYPNFPPENPFNSPTVHNLQNIGNQPTVTFLPQKESLPGIQLAAQPVAMDDPIASTESQTFVRRFLSRIFNNKEQTPNDQVVQNQQTKTDPLSQRLPQSPGVGPPVRYMEQPSLGLVPAPSGFNRGMGDLLPPPPAHPQGVGPADNNAGVTAPPRSVVQPGPTSFGLPSKSVHPAPSIVNSPPLGVPAIGDSPVHVPATSEGQRGKEKGMEKKGGEGGKVEVKKVVTSPGDLRFVPMVTRDKIRWKEEECPQVQGLQARTLRTPLGAVNLYTQAGSQATDTDLNHAFGVQWNMRGVGTLFDRCFLTGDNISLVDIGSGIGAVPLTAARLASEVYAIEPTDQLAHTLCNSARDMNYNNVHVIHNAVADDRGKVSLRKGTSTKDDASYMVDTRNKSKVDPNSPTAFAIKLDDILRLYKITKAVVKIDVHSFEGRALAGANKFLHTVDIPCILMEWKNVHSLKEFGGNYVFDLLSNHGFFPHDVNTLLPLKVFRMHEWPENVLWAKIGSSPVKL